MAIGSLRLPGASVRLLPQPRPRRRRSMAESSAPPQSSSAATLLSSSLRPPAPLRHISGCLLPGIESRNYRGKTQIRIECVCVAISQRVTQWKEEKVFLRCFARRRCRRRLSPPLPLLLPFSLTPTDTSGPSTPAATPPSSSSSSSSSSTLDEEKEEKEEEGERRRRRSHHSGGDGAASPSSSSSLAPLPLPSPLLPPGSSPFDADIAELALPTVVALAADPLLSRVDTAFAGALGAAPLAALGVNSALFTFCFFSFNFLSSASTPLVAAADGAGDRACVGRVAAEAGLLALLLGSVVAALLLRFSAPVLLLMGAPPPELDPEGMTAFAEQYLRWRAGAAPAALLMTVGAGVLRGVG